MRHFLSLLTVLVLAGAGLALPVFTAPVQTAHPVATTVTTVPVPGLDSGVRDAAQGVTPGLAALTQETATSSFMLAGVTWDQDSATTVTTVSVRLRERGAWSGWTDLELAEGPDGEDGQTVRAGTEPLTTTGADGVQARIVTADGVLPGHPQIELVDPGDSTADGGQQVIAASAASAATAKDVLQPAVVTRAQWGADESLGSSWNTYLRKVSALYVHHTAGTTSYTRAQAPKLVRGIYAYHTKSLRWSDVGYQFLVDKFGTIYQGRRAATVDNPIGAQAGGYNSYTIGVSALGDYDSVKPSAALVEGITQVLAWKAYQSGLDPLGKATLVTGSSSKSGTRAKNGQSVRVNVIQGHRDTNYTACPGKYLYADLPDIRADVAQRLLQATVASGTAVEPLAAPTIVKASAKQTPVQWNRSSTYRWKAVTGAQSYQILVQSSSSFRSGAPSSVTWNLYKTVSGTSAKVTISRGATRVIAVRAVDARGRRGPMTILTTSARPVSKKSVVKSTKGWKTVKKKAYWSDTALRATRKGRTLSVKKVKSAKSVSLRVVRGPSAGSVTVTMGGWSTTVDLAQATSDPDAVVTVKFDKVRSGTLRVTTRSSRAVAISGIGFGRPAAADPVVRATGASAPVITSPTTAQTITSGAHTVTWTASAQATSYAVYARKATATAATYGGWAMVGTTSSTTSTVIVPPGASWQIAVLAVKGKAVSRAATAVTLVGGLNLGTLTRSSGWLATPSSGAVAQLRAASAGATLTLPSATRTASLRLRVTTGAGQGNLQVKSGSKVLATVAVSTAAPDASGYVTVPLSAVTSGQLVLQTTDSHPVVVTAVAAVRELP